MGRQAENPPGESEEKYRRLIESAMDAIVVADAESGLILEANQQAARLLGKPVNELVGMHQSALHPPEEAERYKNIFQQHVASGGIKSDVYVRHSDGHDIPVDISASVIEVGGKKMIQGIFHDTTERKQAEAEERAASARYESLLAAIPEIVMEAGLDKRYRWANQAGLEFFGEEVIGREAAHYFVGDQDTYKRIQPLFEGSDDTIYVESLQRRRDGQERLLAWWCKSLKDADGHVIGALSTARDITESRQVEARERMEKMRKEISLTLNRMLEAEEREMLDYVLEQCIRITRSHYSFVGLMSEDESVMHVHAWSRAVMAECGVSDKTLDFPIAKAGIWAEPVRQRKPVIINDLVKEHGQQRSYPSGHVEVRRYLGVPAFDGERIVALVAVANKADEYSAHDSEALGDLLMDAWRLIQRQRSEAALKKRLDEIERMNRLMVGRELKMEELRREVQRLREEIAVLRRQAI